jgi:hypothetical protein
MSLYTQDSSDRYPYSGRPWPQMPLVDLLKLFHPYLPTNSSGFYICPADKPPPWNMAWTKSYGTGFNIRTNELLFGNSYYYYHQFYYDDTLDPKMVQRNAAQVRSPSKKAIMSCFAEPEQGQVGDKNLAHGKEGLPLLFVDSHSAYIRYDQLNKTKPYGDYNLDWTVDGLRGEDLK